MIYLLIDLLHATVDIGHEVDELDVCRAGSAGLRPFQHDRAKRAGSYDRAGTVVTACPFCSIMLKGAQASAPGAADIQFVDLMTYVNGRMKKVDQKVDH